MAELLSSRASLYITTRQALRQLETLFFSLKLNPQTVWPICERTYIDRGIILRFTARTNINMANTER